MDIYVSDVLKHCNFYGAKVVLYDNKSLIPVYIKESCEMPCTAQLFDWKLVHIVNVSSYCIELIVENVNASDDE